jgi:hypothetical protein
MFCAPRLIFGDIEGVPSRLNVFHTGLVFGGTECVGSCFSCFALPDLFSAVSGASDPVLIFCAPGLVFGGTGVVGFRFLVLRAPTHFWRYRGRQVSFSCFALPGSFSSVPMASGPVFMFCARRLIFWGTEDVPSCFHVFRSQTYFRRYRGCQVSISYFVLPVSFPTVPMTSGPVFMFCAPNSFSVV